MQVRSDQWGDCDMSDYYDLGDYSRSISTVSPDAQRWFDRGLIWTYGYHPEEAAVECFKRGGLRSLERCLRECGAEGL